MIVREMIDALSSMDPDATVRVAAQPHYPMEAELYGVTYWGAPPRPTRCPECEHPWHDYGDDCPTIADPSLTLAEPCECVGDIDDGDRAGAAGVWIVTGDHIGYNTPDRIHESVR